MKSTRRFLPAVALALVALAPAAEAQLRTPRPSQKASVMQTVGVTDITITYSRPGVKGRTIWGDPPAGAAAGTATLDDARTRPKDQVIVPYGHVWRTGANEATTFTTTDDVLVNGQPLKAGTYSLHMIPGKDEWTVIFNKTADQWGSYGYDPKQDALRVKARPEWRAESQELLGYEVPQATSNTARVVLRWEKIAVPFTVEVPNQDALVRSKIDALVAAAPADWQVPLAVGNAYFNDDKFDEALAWVERSIKVKETFQNLRTKALILYNMKRRDEAIAAAERAVARGKADGEDTTRFEKRLADIKAGKM
jgi:hypothetical protein